MENWKKYSIQLIFFRLRPRLRPRPKNFPITGTVQMDHIGEHHHAVELNGDRHITVFRDDNSVVIQIHMVVHTQGAWPNSPMSDNHVSVYLLVGNGRSVRINTATDDNDTRGVLIWSQLGYELSNSSIVYFDYQVVAGLMVAHI